MEDYTPLGEGEKSSGLSFRFDPDYTGHENEEMDPESKRQGQFYALLAYGSWGVFPIYWKQLSHLSAIEITSIRLLGSVVVFGILLLIRHRKSFLSYLFSEPIPVKSLLLSSSLIAVNWLLFVYAVNSGQVVETSLGYFMNPLLNVAIGAFILGEKLNRGQWISVGIAAAGVSLMALISGTVPVISLTLAVTFAFYGWARKGMKIAPLKASFIEAAFLAPFALVYLYWVWGRGISYTFSESLLLLGGGPVTAFPLLWFAEAAKLLPLSMLGFFQYLSPTLQFLCGVLIYSEAFSPAKAIGFSLVWLAVVLFWFATYRKIPEEGK